MDREQNYWASLFGAYSNILEAPRSTLQNTSNIVQVVDQRSMLVTYRMGHMALDGYHTLCCADKGSESGMSLRAGDKPHHTASALVVINSDDDSGILPQRTEHALHCQDRVMPSYRYFAVMAHIALEFLMKYDECAILTCYKLQKEFLLPLLVKSISSLANLRKLDKFTASHHVQAKLSFIDPANLKGDSAEKTRNALEYLYQEGNRQDFERFLELETRSEKASRKHRRHVQGGVPCLLEIRQPPKADSRDLLRRNPQPGVQSPNPPSKITNLTSPPRNHCREENLRPARASNQVKAQSHCPRKLLASRPSSSCDSNRDAARATSAASNTTTVSVCYCQQQN